MSKCCMYITVDELRNYKVGCKPVDLSCFSDEDVKEAILTAQEEIECITCDRFCPYRCTYKFDGNCECCLFFPPTVQHKLIELYSVKVADGKGCAKCYKSMSNVKVEGHFLDACCGCKQPSYSSQLCGCGCGCGGYFPEGCCNIIVDGLWGWKCTPRLIKKATKMLAMECLIPGALCGTCSSSGKNVIQESFAGDYSVTYAQDPVSSQFAGSSSGILEVDRILMKFMNHSTLFTTVI